MGTELGIYLIALMAAAAAAAGTWFLGDILARLMEQWRARFQAEAELELEEMFYQMPADKFINYSLSAAGAAAALAFLLVGGAGRSGNLQIGLLFAMLAFAAVILFSRFFLRLLKKHRLEKFNDQLEESLMGMSNSLKAGFSIVQTIEMVVKQNKQPISVEFKLMLQQTRLGMSFDEALQTMEQRVKSEDFSLVSSAIRTARTTGGDLTGVFDRLAVMIRERRRIQRRVRTLTAQGRLQGMVLGCLPMFLLLVLFFLDPQMVKNFFTQPLGIALFILVLILEGCGFLVIRKIVSIDI